MEREVAIARRIPVLVKPSTNCHDLPRTVQFLPLFNLINGVRKSVDEGRVDHCDCPCLATVDVTTDNEGPAHNAMRNFEIKNAFRKLFSLPPVPKNTIAVD